MSVQNISVNVKCMIFEGKWTVPFEKLFDSGQSRPRSGCVFAQSDHGSAEFDQVFFAVRLQSYWILQNIPYSS